MLRNAPVTRICPRPQARIRGEPSSQSHAGLWDDGAITEFHRLAFSRAVEQNLLSDYKVVVLALSEQHVDAALQAHLASGSRYSGAGIARYVRIEMGLRNPRAGCVALALNGAVAAFALLGDQIDASIGAHRSGLICCRKSKPPAG